MAGLIAVTGASGFVGAHCVRALLNAGWRVRVLVRRMPSDALLPGQYLETVLGGLEDEPALAALVVGCDAILHVAGLVRARSKAEFFRVNQTGTQRLVTAAAKFAPKARFLLVSSLAARAPHLSPYAASKRAGEDCLAQLAGSHEVLIVRPSVVYGPGDFELLPLFQAAKAGILPYPAAPNARLSAIHVSDLAAALVVLMGIQSWNVAGLPQNTLEIDDEHLAGYTWPEIIAALTAAVGRRPFAFRLSRFAIAPIAMFASLAAWLGARSRVLSVWKINEIYNPDWVASGPRLSAVSSWQPEFSLADGFTQTLKWYRRIGAVN